MMALYIRKVRETIEAFQWWKNGDHPKDFEDTEVRYRGDGEQRALSAAECRERDFEGRLVRRFRHPDVPGDRECEHCVQQIGDDGTLRYYTMDEHGWLESAKSGNGVVHPGDWIITKNWDEHSVCGRLLFPHSYELAEGEDRDYRKERDAAYTERNRLVAALARLLTPVDPQHNVRAGAPARAWLAQHDPNDADWDPEWRTIVFIDGPTGQLSWHLHDDDVPLFDGLPHGPNLWDGHTTPEKYTRVDRLGRT